MSIDWQALQAPFEDVQYRVGSTTKDKNRGMALAYIDARQVAARLDDVVGPDRWECEYNFQGSTILCTIQIHTDDHGIISKEDGATETDVEGAKGGLSDAFKRAGVKWGIGRYLYEAEAPWVDLVQRGSTHVIAPAALAELRGAGARAAVVGELRHLAETAAAAEPEPEPAKKDAVKELLGLLDERLTHLRLSPDDEAKRAIMRDCVKAAGVENTRKTIEAGFDAVADAVLAWAPDEAKSDPTDTPAMRTLHAQFAKHCPGYDDDARDEILAAAYGELDVDWAKGAVDEGIDSIGKAAILMTRVKKLVGG